MSLQSLPQEKQDSCFPRVSGDEPVSLSLVYSVSSFSPRERG